MIRPPLDESTLRADLVAAGSPWRDVTVVTETGSTNSDVIARAAAGEDVDGVVLIAELQTAGRGRNGRTWSAAPRAQLTFSVGVQAADVPPDAWGWLPLATGVAVVDAVAEVTGVEVGLKWPNDVLAGPHGSGGKLAGILAEVAAPRPLIVLGLGLNVTTSGDELPTPAAASLLTLGVAAPDRELLLRALLHALGQRIGAWRDAGGADATLRADYGARSLTIGSRVRVLLPGASEIVGMADSVDSQGRLRIDTDSGVVTVSAGDVVHLRPLDGPVSG